MLRLVNRLRALAVTLALIGGSAGLCPGWAATPEARMACCADDDCPMHRGESGESDSHHALTRDVLTQAEADACCAASEREQSDTSSPTTIVSIPAPVWETVIVRPAHIPTRVSSDRSRTQARSPDVPRHVLLSVFLV